MADIQKPINVSEIFGKYTLDAYINIAQQALYDYKKAYKNVLDSYTILSDGTIGMCDTVELLKIQKEKEDALCKAIENMHDFKEWLKLTKKYEEKFNGDGI